MTKHSFPLVRLDNVCRPKQWPTISTSQFSKSGYPVYGANGKIGFYSEYTHEEPTILITCRGATCGKLNISEAKSYVNGNAMALDSLDPKRADLRFVYYALLGRGLQDVITGSAQPQITRETLSKVTIPLPPLPEQKRIADILDKADAIRRKRAQALELTDQFLQSVFLDMFGDPVTNPKGWEVKELGAVVKRVVVGHVGPTSQNYVEDGVPFLRTGNVRRMTVDIENMQRISTDFHRKLVKSTLRKDDVLISRVGANRGMSAVVPDELIGANCANIIVISPGTLLVPSYVAFLVNSTLGQSKLVGNTVGSAQGVINVSTVKAWKIPIPAFELQKRFEQLVECSTLLQHRLSWGSNLTTELFDSLVQRAFKGEL